MNAPSPLHCDVAVVGSGFAGSILARALTRRGLAVVLVERGRHPRFALGESSTPLAGFALERLAARYDLPDLRHLSTHGRWLRHLPHLARGLKRGFTFYRHRPGRTYRNGPANDARLLVAASPDDAVADSHWLRADVDAHLVERARAEGVEYLDETTLDGFDRGDRGVRLGGERAGRRLEIRCRRVVDGSGRGGFLATALGLAEAGTGAPRSLVYAHLEGCRRLAEVAPGADFPPGPYPDERAAVHHLLDEGWIYLLPFDHGVTSAGLVLRPQAAAEPGEPPEATWRRLLGRYPSLERALGGARPVVPWRRLDRLQHRLAVAAGPGWDLLPHAYAFFDPLYSTGMAWSLSAVERLAAELAGEADPAGPASHAALLPREADQVEALVDAAYRALPSFARFTAVSLVYFAAVSWAEVRARLGLADPGEGFLGARDPVLEGLSAAVLERLAEMDAGDDDAAFTAWVLERIAPRNLAGLGDPARRNLYPLDADGLVERADLLGLDRAALRAALPRLRG